MKRLKPKAVVYMRVSGQGQVNRTGLGRQKDTIDSFCKINRLKIVGYYSEAHSGTKDNRPIFNQMLEEILSNSVRTIVIESLDRLARDLGVQMRLLAVLMANNISLFSATTGQNVTDAMQSDPMLKAMVQMQGTFAELDKSLLVRKLRKSREKIRRETGRCEGRKPYGYYEGAKEIINYIFKLYKKPRGEKRLGFYEIANRLNKEGVPSRKGLGFWTGTAIKNIIERGKKLQNI